MEIDIGRQPIDGKMNVSVSLYNVIDQKGFSIDMSVWVEDSDSRKELHERARNAAISQLKLALSALEDGNS
ncbi:hypothetical protein [Xanthomonas axonopodis]